MVDRLGSVRIPPETMGGVCTSTTCSLLQLCASDFSIETLHVALYISLVKKPRSVMDSEHVYFVLMNPIDESVTMNADFPD